MARVEGAFPTIVLAGNIAAGKSTLGRLIAERLDYVLAEESVADNPYLERFYSDMTQWAFHLNMYFLGSRSQAILAAASSDRGVVFDRSLYEDLIFVDLARDDGITPADNYSVFRSLYDVLEAVLSPPTVLVYLHAPTNVLHARIQQRGRVFEGGITVEYLERIQRRYDQWIGTFSQAHVLRLDTNSIDYRADTAAVDAVCDRIRELTLKTRT